MGLQIDYFKSLTQRQFYNIVNGYRKKEDILSRERWMITRKMMYAAMAPYLEKNITEIDLLPFPWDKEKETELSDQEEKIMLEGQSQAEDYFARWDARKAKSNKIE